jgi:hypothetical protein
MRSRFSEKSAASETREIDTSRLWRPDSLSKTVPLAFSDAKHKVEFYRKTNDISLLANHILGEMLL